ncbi:MAG: ATP-binding cassette domain-containing protein [Candidatus Delongbacteria bacterium]|nr:ATP-binding cassette domain-containing protein [Candidatus Delongbacteria bacterium]MCG2760548.1 ATP-binding cassette domain-containing protein [Candidatus Delongbacteria bacterium]
MPLSVYAQKYLDYKEKGLKPDIETIRNIEDSKLIFFTKLFAAVALLDNEVTELEHAYVLEFYWMNYPDSIAFYLFDRFQDYISQNISFEVFEQSNYDNISYGEKLFMLFKIFEFLNLQNIERLKSETGEKIADILGVEKNDYMTAKEIYSANFIPRTKYPESKIKFIYISDEKDNSDFYLPYEGLKGILLNVEKCYFMIKLDHSSTISIGNFNLQPMTAFNMPYGSNIKVNDYFIESEDVKLYLKIKYNLYPDKEFFINDLPDEIILDKNKKNYSIARVLFRGCKIIITPLDRNTIITVNDKDHYDGDAFVNVNDFVKVNESFVNLRKVIYQEFFGNEYIKLERGKNEYLLSNFAGSDIYISDKSEHKWEGKIILKDGKYYLNTGTCYHPVWIIRNNSDSQINKQTGFFGWSVKKEKWFQLLTGDIIYIQGNVLKFNLEDGMFEKTYFRYITYRAENLEYSFRDKTKALDNVSFEIDHGDLVCIMGPSGSGKSTLLKILCGMIAPQKGNVYADNFNFFEYYQKIKRFISFVPQDDVLFENLTVYENLYFNAKLRFPKLNEKSINERVKSVIKEIGLYSKKNMKVGTESEKILSGGERKRLNIGLELLSDSNMFFFDEPTSGLSSKDSEKVVEILKRLAVKGKIIFTVIHQPSYKIYNKFNKTIVLDHGGKLAFCGSAYNALQYFKQFNRYDSDVINENYGKNDPDILLDTLEEPLRDIDGTILPERKFSPEFWKGKFSEYIKSLRPVKIPPKDLVNDVPSKNYDLEGKLKQFATLFKRNFHNKSRDKSNLLITFIEAPLLAAIVGFILRYIPVNEYTLYNNIHLPVYIFLTVIIGMFLAMSNSSDEIIKDVEVIRREKMLNINYFRYYLSKFITQLIFASIQNIFYIIVSFAFLEIKELHFHYFALMTMVSITGISLGFFISSIPGLTVKAVQNIVPLILIPQIIFGGALIQYKELNSSLTIYENSPIPEVCQIMPSRWAYEGLIVMQDSYNRYHSAKDKLQQMINEHVWSENSVSEEGKEEYKNTKSRLLDKEMAEFRRENMSKYGNMEVHRTVASGNDRFSGDYDVLTLVYPIFTRGKILPFINLKVNTAVYNSIVLLFISLIVNLSAYWMLSREELLRTVFGFFKSKKSTVQKK